MFTTLPAGNHLDLSIYAAKTLSCDIDQHLQLDRLLSNYCTSS